MLHQNRFFMQRFSLFRFLLYKSSSDKRKATEGKFRHLDDWPMIDGNQYVDDFMTIYVIVFGTVATSTCVGDLVVLDP